MTELYGFVFPLYEHKTDDDVSYSIEKIDRRLDKYIVVFL